MKEEKRREVIKEETKNENEIIGKDEREEERK